ncbi:hypothetical protein F2Q69_00013540 [Brassica cretica]|uniref:Uncharacterized protein n=1 Tax=Brassica cretica TaxID=69181 RepID=A0A8S9R1W0_BRACR|nr:hypothetical protein F2Q69_00013540 [Brassica cretica]
MRGSSNLFEGRRSETNIDQSTSCAVDRQRSAQNQARLPAVLNPKSHHIYRNTSVLCHCLREVRKTKLDSDSNSAIPAKATKLFNSSSSLSLSDSSSLTPSMDLSFLFFSAQSHTQLECVHTLCIHDAESLAFLL